jgi:hypothetical protein
VEQFKYLGKALRNQNQIYEIMKISLNTGTLALSAESYSSHLLLKNIKTRKQRTIILPVVLYGSLTLMGKHRPTAFENRMLRKIFGSKRDEDTGEWRRIKNEERYDLYSSPTHISVLKARRKGCGGGKKCFIGTYWR